MSLAVHEVRAPVSVIAGYVGMLLKESAGPLTDQQRRLLSEVHRAVGRCSGLLADLSELSRLQAGGAPFNCGRFELAGLLREEVDALPPMEDGRDIAVTLRNEAGGAAVHADAARLRRAFAALCLALRRELVTTNELTVALRRRDCGGRRTVEVLIAGSDWIRTLEGAEPDRLELFHPDAEYRGGVGFTLPIARRIIEGHQGQIWSAVDNPKAGAIVSLPEA